MSNSKLHITTKHTGKMAGMQSLSTACVCNPYCMAYSEIKGSVCEKCYAQRQMDCYGENFQKPFIKNYEILNSRLLDESEIPQINASFFRFEAFGDIGSEIHYMNYLLIADANPETHFAIWTKNINIMRWVHNHLGWRKPENLIIVYSGLKINEQPEIQEDYWFVDKIFTVYNEDFINENQIIINCGSRNCRDCLLCYRENKIRYINEKLK